MSVDCITHNHSFILRKHILQRLLEIWDWLLWAKRNVFFDIWKILDQWPSRLLQNRRYLWTWVLRQLFIWRSRILKTLLGRGLLLLLSFLLLLARLHLGNQRFHLFRFVKWFIIGLWHRLLLPLHFLLFLLINGVVPLLWMWLQLLALKLLSSWTFGLVFQLLRGCWLLLDGNFGVVGWIIIGTG